MQIPLSLGYNDLIFKQLESDEKEILQKIGVYYSVLFLHLCMPATHWPATSLPVTRLLNPPAQLDENAMSWVKYALGMLSREQYLAATAILPVLNNLKSGPFGRNAIQHPVPTIEEATRWVFDITGSTRYIEQSPLSLDDKSTLITSLTDGLETLRGDALFLPANGNETQLESLEKEIEALELQIALAGQR
jgi:hypothetical protein